MSSFISDASEIVQFDAFYESHLSSYANGIRSCCEALECLWKEMGLYSNDAQTELMKIASTAQQVWQSAVTDVETQRDAMRRRIHEVETETHGIQAQLGETSEKCDRAEMTLRQKLDMAMKLRDQSLEMKRQRVTEFKGILDRMQAIRNQFGESTEHAFDFDAPNCTLTMATLDFIKCELETLCAERNRRMGRLDTLWRPIKRLCSELGEDPINIVTAVHPKMECIDQSLTGIGLAFSIERSPNLSERSFVLMEEQLSSLTNERSNRENELVSMKGTLLSLWDALQTPNDDLDRSILSRLIEGPARLHRKTFDKIREEIRKQETAKARILKDLALHKIMEIRSICEGGHLPIPQEVTDIQASLEAGHCGDALAQLTRIATSVTIQSEKRSVILNMISELQSSRSEVDWLTHYETDDDRYKGRDCNRKLQRAIKAGRLRDRLPGLVEKLTGVMMEWERSEHRPFIFDGIDYRTEVLEKYELPQPKSARGLRKTPSGRRTPSGRLTPKPDLRSPSRSRRPTSRSEDRVQLSHHMDGSVHPMPMLKDTQTDYHPLQERLDRLLNETSTTKIPTTPSTSHGGSISLQSSPNAISPQSSEDETMEDVQMSLPPPQLKLPALGSLRRPTM